MNMALIALASASNPVCPPLSLAYLAALLEQRRHIVRIYDLALEPEVPLAEAFQPLRSFLPTVVIVTGEYEADLEAARHALQAFHDGLVLAMLMSRNGLDAWQVSVEALTWFEQQHGQFKQEPLPASCNQLPLPARHLLSLERYALRAAGGELQTSVAIAGLNPVGDFVLRMPTQIVAELRSLAHEFGVRHYLFTDVPVTMNLAWLDALLHALLQAQLRLSWEAHASFASLEPALLARMARAGCECLVFDLDAPALFESLAARQQFRQVVASARDAQIFVRANLKLEPPYESLTRLIDVAASFGLDGVSFDVSPAVARSVGADAQELRQLAHQLYAQGRDRQRWIDRFGPALGNLIWHLRGLHVSNQPD
ncbi:MAG: hypothetical protein EOM24_23290 [Chloroflexia bacterium]|nr:hypothetical protein [Chloroflexia bacterium]